jgi:hypothetical protein
MGSTRYYNIQLDSYAWDACEVMAWDAEQLTFLVRMTSGMVKHVKRLNLRFTAPEEEDEADFEKRLAHVKAQRAEAESMLRYHHYLETTGDDGATPVRIYSKRLLRPKGMNGLEMPSISHSKSLPKQSTRLGFGRGDRKWKPP